MRDPRELFEVDTDAWSQAVGRPVPMLHLLDGFLDSGRTQHGLVRHLLRTSDPVRLATFDIDQLHDYRSRRPVMTFDTFAWTEVKEPFLVLDQLKDQRGRPFVVLHGQEPDTQWERTIAAVLSICGELGIERLFTAGGIPLAVPHTRPTSITRHATDEALVRDNPPMIDRMDVPAAWSALLEFRAGKAGLEAMGYVAHVPHYLSQVYFPQAVLVTLEALMVDTGLVLPTEGLVTEVAETKELIDAEVAGSAETTEMVEELEIAFDEALTEDRVMPTTEEIQAELETFLQNLDNGDDR